MSTTEKPIPRTPLAFFLYVIRPHRKWVLFTITITVVAAAATQGTSYFFKLIIDAAEAGRVDQAVWWGIAYPIAIFLAQLVYRLNGILGMVAFHRAGKTATDVTTEYVLRHSHTYFGNRFAGSVVNKIRNIFHAVEETLLQMIWVHLESTVTFLVTFLLISSVDLLSGALFLLLLMTLLAVNLFLAPQKAKYSKAFANSGTELQSRLSDTIGNVSAVRQYTKAGQEQTELERLSGRRMHAGLTSSFYTEKMLLINTVIIFVFSLGIFWLLVGRWSDDVISTGDFILVLALFSQIIVVLLFLGRAVNTTAKGIGELREALEELLIPHEITDVPEATPLKVTRGDISWQTVHFHYENETIFKDFTLDIQAHERIGLVGPSGAGKSTFVSLLLRQHDLTGGRICIDGQDISTVTQESLRANVSVVPQEPLLFHRTIRENIAYGNLDATENDIQIAARQAYAHDFITTLPNGYDTMVGERGVKLSGGQKQRVAIARAMLKNAPILILDEATSALDSESEVVIQKALHELMRGKTVIAIAHRLSTLREMDRILVLDHGAIVEEGTHNELKRSGGLYQRLWEHQAGGFTQS